MVLERLHVFVRGKNVAIPPVKIEDDMIDVEDIGLVYNSQAAAVANRAALLAYLSERAALGVWLAMAGPKNPANYNNKREPGEVYIDLAAGAIPVSVGGPGHPSFHLEGSSKLIGINALLATTPVVDIVRDLGSVPRVTLKDFALESDGSGIRLEKMGTLTQLEQLAVKATGLTVADPENLISFDDFADIDTAVYGVKLVNCDGTNFVSCFIHECGGHGVMADRWHAGNCSQTQSWSNAGSGWKLRFMNGVLGQFRGESNKGWGIHLEDCGSVTHGNVPPGGTASTGTISEIHVWCENNNKRDSLISTTGHPFRQMRLGAGTGRLRVIGHSGYRPNMIDAPRSTRRMNHLIEDNWLDPSEIPAQDMKTLTTASLPDFSVPGGTHNWDTQWTNSSERPSVVIVSEGMSDQRLEITLPANCYAGSIAAGDFWQPMGSSPIAVAAGDVLRYSAKLSIDAAGVSMATGNEAASPRQSGMQFDISIDPFSAANLQGAALFDTDAKQFGGMVFVDTNRNANLAIRLVASDEAQRFAGNQPSQIKLTIHEFLLYKVAAAAP